MRLCRPVGLRTRAERVRAAGGLQRSNSEVGGQLAGQEEDAALLFRSQSSVSVSTGVKNLPDR